MEMMQSPLSIFLIVALICSAVVYAGPIPDADKPLLHGILGPDEGHLHKRELIEEHRLAPPGVAGEVEGHLHKRELIEEQRLAPPGVAGPGTMLPPGIPGVIEEDRVAEDKPSTGLAEDRQKRKLAPQQETAGPFAQ